MSSPEVLSPDIQPAPTSHIITADVHDTPDLSTESDVPPADTDVDDDAEDDSEDDHLLPVIPSPVKPKKRTKSCKRRKKSPLYAFGSSHRRDRCPYCMFHITEDSQTTVKKKSLRHHVTSHNGLSPEMTSRVDDIRGIYHQPTTPVHAMFREKMEERISQIESLAKEKFKPAVRNSPCARGGGSRKLPKQKSIR